MIVNRIAVSWAALPELAASHGEDPEAFAGRLSSGHRRAPWQGPYAPRDDNGKHPSITTTPTLALVTSFERTTTYRAYSSWLMDRGLSGLDCGFGESLMRGTWVSRTGTVTIPGGLRPALPSAVGLA